MVDATAYITNADALSVHWVYRELPRPEGWIPPRIAKPGPRQYELFLILMYFVYTCMYIFCQFVLCKIVKTEKKIVLLIKPRDVVTCFKYLVLFCSQTPYSIRRAYNHVYPLWNFSDTKHAFSLLFYVFTCITGISQMYPDRGSPHDL